MNARPLRIGWMVPGTMMRLGLHTGAFLAWFFYQLPAPVVAFGTSVGALVLSIMISFDRAEMHRMASLVGNLKREQIYTLSKGLIHNTGAYLFAAGAAFVVFTASAGGLGLWWAMLLIALASAYIYLIFRGTQKHQWILRIGIFLAVGSAGYCGAWSPAITFWIGLFAFDWLVRQAIRTFIKECEAPFDTMPLFKLLRNNISFRHFFGANTRLGIVTAEIETPSMYMITNRDHGLCDPENPEHCDRIANSIRATTSLPGRFPMIHLDGKVLVDAEVWSAYPIDQFKKEDVDIIFYFDYWPALEPEPAPTTFIGNLFRSFDVLRDRGTIKTMEEYALEVKHDPTLPRVVHIRMSEDLKARVPRLAVYDFKPGQLWRAIRLGYRIIKENLPLIRRELGIDTAQESTV